MTAEPDRMVPAEVMEHVERLLASMRFAEKCTEGHSWVALYGAVAALDGACKRLLAMTEVDGRARLPFTAETQARVMAGFVVPDHLGDGPDEGTYAARDAE